jgi:hypothetical protein
MSLRSNLSWAVRMAGGLDGLMRRPLTVEKARDLVRQRMASRADLFLQVVREAIWQNPRSPYHHLLRRAGWTYDSVADSVRHKGLEPTLEALRHSGVYLTHPEFKDHKPIVRDGLTLDWSTLSVENPMVLPTFEAQTGGTRSQGSRVPASLTYVSEQRAITWCLILEAIDGGAGPTLLWLPRSAGYLWWLTLMHLRRPPLRWMSTTDLSVVRVPRLHRLMYRVAQGIGLSHGLRIPVMEHVPLTEAERVLDVVLWARARYGSLTIVGSPSGAARLAGLASRRGDDLNRVAFIVGGEPLTPGKHAEITRAGARVGVRYNITELGAIGGACGNPGDFDDTHFLSDSFAMILDRRPLPDGRTVDAFMLTTILPTSPLVLINLDTDDFGTVTERRCGCVWDALGLRTHISGIRSFSKLTGEGVTVLGTECIRIIEEILPKEFGGRSVDYQLLEVEDADHLTRLQLVVSPSVGSIDEARLLRRFHEELYDPVQGRGFVPPMWRQVDTVRVVRREPVVTAAGKLLPFHTLALSLARDGQSRADELPAG